MVWYTSPSNIPKDDLVVFVEKLLEFRYIQVEGMDCVKWRNDIVPRPPALSLPAIQGAEFPKQESQDELRTESTTKNQERKNGTKT